MTNKESAEQALADWAERHRELMAERDQLVRNALAAGSNFNRIRTLTGMSRTTLYAIRARPTHY